MTVFEDLRQAVNRTHGSLHHAFLAWDKAATGELTKARLRVGLRACRGAEERDVESFMDALSGDLEGDGKITFHRLYQAFHDGEKRFPALDTSSQKKKALPDFFAHSPSLPAASPFKANNDDDDRLSRRLDSARISSPRREHYRSPLATRPTISSPKSVTTSPHSRTPREQDVGTRSAPSPQSVNRRLDFSATGLDALDDGSGSIVNGHATSSPVKNAATPPRALSPSSARFQVMREARTMSPNAASFHGTSVPRPLDSLSPYHHAPANGSLLQASTSYDMGERRLSLMRGTRRYASMATVSSYSPAHSGGGRMLHDSASVGGFSRPFNEAHSEGRVAQISPVKVDSIRRELEPALVSPRYFAAREPVRGYPINARTFDDDIPLRSLKRADGDTLLNPTVRAELKATLITMASNSPSSPVEATIAPSDLRRSLHTVDPSLSRQEVRILARHLLGGDSPQRVRVAAVLCALDEL